MALYKLYIEKVVYENQLIVNGMTEVVVKTQASTSDYSSSMKKKVLEKHETVSKYVASVEFRNIQQSFKKASIIASLINCDAIEIT